MADLRPWRTRSHDVLFSSGPVREVAVESVELPDGRIVPDFYVIRLPDYVLVYAEMDDGTVGVLRQYKHGPKRVCLSFPGGAIEEGEAPLEAARRELREELGCDAERWQSLGSFVTNANQRCNTAHLFRAVGCRRVAAPRSGDLEEMAVEFHTREALLGATGLAEFALVSHVALLLLAGEAPVVRP